MTRAQRQLGFIAAALLVSAGLYGLWWTSTAEAAKAELERWIEERRQAGFVINHEGITTSGFPLRFDLIVAKPQVARAGSHPFSWQGPDQVVARIHPLSPNHLALDAKGTHLLERDGQGLSLSFERAEIGIDAGLNGIEALQLDLAQGLAERAAQEPLRLGRLTLNARRDFTVSPDDLQTPTAALALEVEQLILPSDAKPLLGPELPRLSLRLSMHGPFPEELKAEPLAVWAEAGGTLEIEALHLDWPPLAVDGDGTLALDRQLLPIAPFGLKAKGVFETVDALSERSWIEDANALPLKLALAVLAKQPPDPDTGLMRLPLTIQGRDLFIGSARVARLPNPPWISEE